MSHRPGIHRFNTDSSVVLTSGERFIRFALAGTGGFIVQVGTLVVLASNCSTSITSWRRLVAVEAAILVELSSGITTGRGGIDLAR